MLPENGHQLLLYKLAVADALLSLIETVSQQSSELLRGDIIEKEADESKSN